jgi:hypothetical protein
VTKGDPDSTDVDPIPGDVTKEHDVGEWLAVFNEGVTAGRKDVMQALKKVLGDTPMAHDVELRMLEAMIDPGKP